MYVLPIANHRLFTKSSTVSNNLLIRILKATFTAICCGVNLIGYFRIYKRVRFSHSGKLQANVKLGIKEE